MRKIEKADLLARHFLFRGLEVALIERLVELSVTCRLARNDVLFRRGDEGGALYGVLEGAIRIAVRGSSGRGFVLGVMEPGDLFGEIALLDGLPRSADASALIPTCLVEIRRRDFLALVEREPKLSMHLIEMFCERLRRTTDLVEDMVFLPLSARLAKRVLALAIAYGRAGPAGTEIELEISQSELAQMVGATRERVCRLLADWTRRELIALGRYHLTLRDHAALERIAGERGEG